ncbi:MAG: PKD domain-containing protein [bacterium]|nr:PKD domain-containing protein [bacterium]
MTRVRTTIVSVFAAVAFGGSIALAQLTSSSQEVIKIPIGTIFEIQAATSKDAKVNWVLSEETKLIESSRDAVFRTRFSKEGNFILAAEVNAEGKKAERMFFIEVRQLKVEDRLAPGGVGDIVAIDPPIYKDTIPMSLGKQVISITPNRDDVKILAIDFDTLVDSNGDGNLENDEDTRNTLFRSEGNPLHVWFVNATPRTIRLGALLKDGTANFTSYAVGSKILQENPQEMQKENSNIDDETQMRIMVLKSDNGEVHFSLRLPVGEEKPLLLHWNFGDGITSLHDRPIHDFAESGLYKVQVEVRDLKTGKVLETVQEDVTVNRLKEDTTTVEGPDGKTNDPLKNVEKQKEGSAILGIVIKLILSLVGSSVIGALIFFIIGKVKKKGFSLEGVMEKAEKTMVKTPEEAVKDVAPPMEILAEEIPEPPQEDIAPQPPVEIPEPEVIITPSEPAPDPEPAPTPETAATPSWLQETVPAPAATAPVEPAPLTAPIVDTPAPNVDHTALQPSVEQLQADTNNAPDWLQAGIQKAEAEGQTPATPVEDGKVGKVAPPPEPAVVPAPTTEPVPAAPVDGEKSPEALDRERERKRKKRQRYRENLKTRKGGEQEAPESAAISATESDDNEPVAFITAEDIEPMEVPPMDTPDIDPGEKPA